MEYYCSLSQSNDSGYEVYFPDVEGVFTDGTGKSHALDMAKEALECMLESLIGDNSPIPFPKVRQEEGLYPIQIEKDLEKKILKHVDLFGFSKPKD